MGEIADMLIEQMDMDELYFGDLMDDGEFGLYVQQRRKLLYCKFCDRGPLRWKHLQTGWVMFEQNGEVHDCPQNSLPLNVLKELYQKQKMNEELAPIPGWDELFMRHAYLISTKSKDKSSKIGSVMVRDNSIIAEGYNGLPRGVNDNVLLRDERPEKYFWYEHAERNAIYNCAKHGITTNGATLYFFAPPCADCARAIIQSGIKEIVHHKQWDDVGFNKADPKWMESTKRSNELLREGGINVRWFDKKLNIKTLISGKVHEV